MTDPAHHRRRKILVADDAFDSRQLLSRLLSRLVDADIHEARHGLAASQEYRLTRPQITFLDIDMPERDGMTVLKEIREIDANAFVVMVSAHSVLDKVQEAIAMGIGGFVVKPYSARRIVDVLKKYASESGDTELLRPE